MSWTAPAETDLEHYLIAQELAAVKRYLSDNQTDPVEEALANAVDRVRGYIAANNKNTLGATGTIPATLKETALVIARNTLLGRLPNDSLLTEGRKEAHRDAIATLKDVAAGRFAVTQPETAAAAQTRQGTIEVATSTSRKATREKLSGL